MYYLAMSSVAAKPSLTWDLSPMYSGLDSADLTRDLGSLAGRIAGLERELEGVTSDVDVARFERVINEYNDLNEKVDDLMAYLYLETSTDSRNELAMRLMTKLEMEIVPLASFGKRLNEWIGGLDLQALLAQSEVARAHEHQLRRIQIAAKHQMSMVEERLAADMTPTSALAWARLYDNLTSQIEVNFERDGKTERLPITAIRNLASDPDRDVRRRAFEVELAAWKANETPIAAALNSIKGHVLKLNARRGWEHPLDEALFHSSIDRETLQAMQSAVRDALPVYRRYLRAKARAIGVERLAFFDLFAPVGKDREWTLDSMKDFIARQFYKYSDRLGRLAQRSYDENWIDWLPRPGKVGGAYCNHFMRDQSRILMNFQPTFGSGMTLAHELGHAYHNHCLEGRTALQRETPMTLAETASIFCETIVKNAALEEVGPEEQVVILEESLQNDLQTGVDILSRFIFESKVFEARKESEASPSELCQFMRDAQAETYGDGLDASLYHPYMWAAKPHYYSTYSYYNFPYCFGRLFGYGLYARYEKDPDGFKAGYDDLLSSTGLASATDLAARYGIDIRDKAFWASSLELVARDVERFEDLVSA